MNAGKRCTNPKHNERDFTTAWRPGLGMLCVACHIDARTSSVKAQAVQMREQNDRYAQMAVRYNVK